MELNYQPFRREKSIRKALKNNPPLKRGSKGRGVEALQKGLVKCGHKLPNSTQAAGQFDGLFGKETAKVIKIFQKKAGLTPSNGTAGSDTISALDNALSGHDKKQSRAPSPAKPPAQYKAHEIEKILSKKSQQFVKLAPLQTPTAARLERAFTYFRIDNKGPMPCRRNRDLGISGPRVHNQCAVRMSVALSRSMGRDILDTYTDGEKHSEKCCTEEHGTPYSHITGATPLLEHLESNLGLTFEKYKKIKPSQLEKRKGIIFFKNCFSKYLRIDGKKIPLRDEDGNIKLNKRNKTLGYQRTKNKTGSHIDYWNGVTYTNAARGGSRASKKLKLFKSAEKIYFCELK